MSTGIGAPMLPRGDVRVRVGDVALGRLLLPAGRTVIDGAPRAAAAVVRMVVVRSGALTVDGSTRALHRGDAVFTGRGRTYRVGREPVELVSTTVPVSRLRGLVDHVADVPIEPIVQAPLVGALARAAARLLDGDERDRTADADKVGAGLINLQCAVLAQVLGERQPLTAAALLHDRALALIDARLGDRELRPPLIAEALGVSPRYLHLVFEHRGPTVARTIRHRRLDAVADAVRRGEAADADRLAERFGFSDARALRRAFAQRFGSALDGVG